MGQPGAAARAAAPSPSPATLLNSRLNAIMVRFSYTALQAHLAVKILSPDFDSCKYI